MTENPDAGEVFFNHSDRPRGLLVRTNHSRGEIFITQVLKKGRVLHHFESYGEAAATRMHIDTVRSAENEQLPSQITPP